MKTVTKCILFSLLPVFLSIKTCYAQPSVDGYQVYYGSLHNHSNVSDGQGTPDEAYNYAKNVAHLDFFGLADHSNLMNAGEWVTIKSAANMYNEDGVFAAFYGFEWTTYFSYGHVTVVNTEDYCSTGSPTNTFTGLISWLNARDGIAYFNHPGWDPLAFNEFDHFSDPPCSKFVGLELWNDHDGFSKYYYNNGYYSNDGNKGYYDEALIRHWKIGAAGGDDNHTATWGTATDFRMGVLAIAKTRTAIFDALLARRCFSTLDKNLVLSLKINGFDMGSTIQGGTWNMEIQSFDTDNEIITNVDLLKNGAVIQSWTPGIIHPIITGSIVCADGDYFYARVKEADGNEAISSPVFISGIAQPPQVAITTPANGAVFTEESDIAIVADASDIDGTITKVEFYRDDFLLGQDNFPPYTMIWPAALTGNYTLTAKAFDNTNLVTTSGGITVIIEPPVPTLTVTPANRDVDASDGSTTFTVNSNSEWVVASNQSWCTVNSSGIGDGTITAQYTANSNQVPRIAEITVSITGLAPVVVTVSQEGMANKQMILTVLLQGLYNGNGTMHPASNNSGNPQWGGGIADRITVELHDNSNYQNIIYSIPDVELSIEGTAVIPVPPQYNGAYYVTVKHRNSIETVSSSAVSFSGASVIYNFNVNTKAFGNNMILMPDGWWVIYGGDINQDGILDSADIYAVAKAAADFITGYSAGDINGDGMIDALDLIVLDNNSAMFISKKTP